MKRAVLIKPDGSVSIAWITDSIHTSELKQMQHFVGGYVEGLPQSLNRWPNFTVFVDEDGRDKHLPPNELASSIFLPFSHFGPTTPPLVGNVLVMGQTTGDGETHGLTVEQADIFLSPSGEDILNTLAETSR